MAKKEQTLNIGIIEGFDYQPMSGGGYLYVRDVKTKKTQRLFVDAGITIRSLNRAFGSIRNAIGKKILWWKGEWTDMGGFIPYDAIKNDKDIEIY